MAKAISVKIKKEKVIAALQARLAQDEAIVLSNKQVDADYEKAVKEYHDLLVSQYLGKLKLSGVSTRWNRIEITYDYDKEIIKLPTEPERGNRERELGTYEVDDIKGSIRMLEMADDEFVNASTMKSISQYL